jgi:hypothetical protein
MSPIDVDTRLALRQTALTEIQAEHADLWDAWKVVESKAQPIAALAGVFLAGVFTYLGQLPANATPLEHYFLLAISVLLVTCAVCALRAIWVADVRSPYLSSVDVDEVGDMLRTSSDASDLANRHERMIQAAVTRWTLACTSLRLELQRKQRLLRWCLGLLGTASVLSVPLVFWTLFERVATK